MTNNAAQDVATATPESPAGSAGSDGDWNAPASPARRYDVAIVGASIAGCAAATLLARRDLSVLLIDKKRTHDDYKPICTTFIQPSAQCVQPLAHPGVERRLHPQSPTLLPL